MKLKRLCLIINVLSLCLATGCNSLPPTRSLIKPPKYSQKATEHNADYKAIAKSFLPENTKYLYPIHPNGADAVQLVDIEDDGEDEIFITYKGYELGSSSGAIVLKKEDNEWRELWHEKNVVNVLGLDWAQFIDIDDDSICELLLGWNLGFEIGYILNIISFNDKPKKISSIEYNEMDVVNISGTENERKPEIVLTRKGEDQKDIDVPPLILRWVDDGLVPAEDAYYSYYKDSINMLKESMGIYDRSFIKWYKMAEMLIRSNRTTETIEAADRALKIISEHYEKYRVKLEIYKAEALIKEWEYHKGRDILDSILLRELKGELDCTKDELAQTHLNLGRAYKGLKDYETAMRMYERSYKLIQEEYNEGTELFILNIFAVKNEIAALEDLKRLTR